MKFKNLTITSPSTLDFELDITSPVCVLHGEHSDLVLDLMRELIGDCNFKNDPDQFDDGHFVIHSDIELDGKNYQICYIRNADFLGDNRIAANFIPNSFDYSKDDTVEFVDKCNQRNQDLSNVIYCVTNELNTEDDRPVFVYLSDNADLLKINSFLGTIVDSGRQVFISSPSSFLEICHDNIQTIILE